MTLENRKKHDEKLKRINDATALKEPDRVPVAPNPQLYTVFHSGYTVAEVVYDTSLEKMRKALIKYHADFDPDVGAGPAVASAGEGPIMETIKPKNMQLPGVPGEFAIDENSLQQFIEFPLLLDDEFEEFFADRSGWEIRKALPRIAGVLEPLKKLQYTYGEGHRSARALASVFGSAEFRSMIQDLWEIDSYYRDHQAKSAKVTTEIMEMGYPMIRMFIDGGLVPFDFYSDYLRGTILTMEDFFERPQDIERFIDENMALTEERILSTKGSNEGKQIFIPLHKGMDGFMSGELYRKYYWPHLQRVIHAIIESGKVPYIYTEGKYNTRIDCLAEVPPGKVVYHFEDVDMAEAKRKLGGIACISGGFPAALLDWGKPEQVRDEVKRLLDVCAPGGGYIFETSCGMGKCKRENVEAMFETAMEYGVY